MIAGRFALAALLTGAIAGAARAQEGRACRFQTNVAQTCGQYACIPSTGADAETGDPGTCGRCWPAGVDSAGADQCGGRACNADGTCEGGPILSAPEPVWPTFHLLVVDASVTVADAEGYSGKPILGAGYLFQAALGTTDPRPLPDGGYETSVPRFYIGAGAAFALAGRAQNAFFNLGLAVHVPGAPAGVTNVALDALYQRTGTAIWQLDPRENVDRLGPALSVGFLYNVYLRGGYVWALNHDSPQDSGAVVLSLVYMQDLLGDLLPDRFHAFVPEELKP